MKFAYEGIIKRALCNAKAIFDKILTQASRYRVYYRNQLL